MEFIEEFIGFYAKRGFWVDRRPDLLDLRDARRLCGIVGEIVFFHESEAFSAAVTARGMILLHCRTLAKDFPWLSTLDQFNEALEWREQFVSHAYALQLLLESASIRLGHPNEIHVGEVTPDNTQTVGMFHGEPMSTSQQGGRFINEEIRNLDSYVDFVSHHGRIPQHFAFSPFHWSVISSATLKSAMEQFERVVSQPDVVKWMSFITRSKICHNKNDFSVSFLLCWFVIESVCKVRYADHLRADPSRDDIEVRAPMHRILGRLAEAQIITAEQYASIEQVKRKRNAFIHQPDRTRVTPDDCLSAARLAVDLAMHGQDLGIVLNWNCGLSF